MSIREALLKLIKQDDPLENKEISDIIQDVLDLGVYKETNAISFIKDNNIGLVEYTKEINETAQGRYILAMSQLLNLSLTHIALTEAALVELSKNVKILTLDKQSGNLFEQDHYLVQLIDCIKNSKIAKPTQYTLISVIQVFCHLRKTVESEKEVMDKFSQMDATDVKAYFVKNNPTLEKQLSEVTQEQPIKHTPSSQTLKLEFPKKQ